MKLVVISGRSGSGKTTALHALEDAGYNCVDNLPVVLLKGLMKAVMEDEVQRDINQAVCIDARAFNLSDFPEILLDLDRLGVDCQVIYLDALSPTLVKRFSETRRRHPLTNQDTDLKQAIDTEQQILGAIADLADLTIDTTLLAGQDLVEMIKTRVIEKSEAGLSLLFRSFGFKYGVPVDADYVFDIRCLPNPHWIPELRPLTGRDDEVKKYLNGEAEVQQMYQDIRNFLTTWASRFEENNRTYLTVGIGCTGGQHRSVFMAETLAAHFKPHFSSVLVRHRQLANWPKKP